MSDTPQLKLYNTLTRKKEVFVPIDADNVRMYVCGPTVYDFAHIGNARPVIVFDVLYRLLRHLYGKDHVTYVRNITDVDDKINARALRDFPDLPLNEAIAKVTQKTANQFHADVKSLGCLEPDHEPRATQHIEGMVKMIQTLIEKGHAYKAGGEVLFDVSSMANYGKLSNRKLEDQRAGARIATTDHKKNPGDFVLWKLSTDNQPGWESPWGTGRPGWHIECSVMSEHHLGKTFDIHGGGLDLIFPHHENEIAQSCCAHGNDKMANYWMHNGFLQVEGKKMSKSDGNFVTISDLIDEAWPGEVVRYNMLKTHYRQPIDWTEKELDKSFDQYMSLIETASRYPNNSDRVELVLNALNDDLNTSLAISELLKLQKSAESGSIEAGEELYNSMQLMGFSDLQMRGGIVFPKLRTSDAEELDLEFGVSTTFLLNEVFELFPKNFPLGAMLRALHAIDSRELGITNEINTICNMLAGISKHTRIGDLESKIDNLDNITGSISDRLTHINNKDWSAADAIRDELLTQGVQLKDGKDPDTGERVTTWEVKR